MKQSKYLITLDNEKQEELGEWSWEKRTTAARINNSFGGIGSGDSKRVFCLKPEVKAWCEENIPKRHRYSRPYDLFYSQVGQVEILFWDVTDSTYFKMRWGGT